MMTRNVAIKELEAKLRATLRELDISKALSQKLLQEQEESEVEVENINAKNTFLKKELAELHIQHMDLADQHSQLQHQVSIFQKCSDTYEQALNHISELEQELCNAHKALSIAESVKVREQVVNTNNLFDELVGSYKSKSVCEPAVTIDLTGDDTIPLCPIVMSHNKLKKYIKIKKVIKRSQRAIKKQNLLKLNIYLRKDRVRLVNSLNTCTREIDECREKYDTDTQLLQNDLLYKEYLLKDIYEKYETSQQQLSERLFEAGELLDLVKYNAERYESLTNNLSCSCADHLPPTPEPELDLSPPLLALPAKSCVSTQKNKTILICDELGSGFGKILHNYLSHSFTNHSYHNISFKQMINGIVNLNLDSCSTMVLLLGNSTGITRKDIVDGVDALLKLNIGKLMLCAFPYAETLSDDDNKHIFKLNSVIHMLTCCHSDKLLYFDTNKFVSGFKLTQGALSLSGKSRHLIAMLIAYNINEVIANITNCRISDEPMLPSYTNNMETNYCKFLCSTKEDPPITLTSLEATTSQIGYSLPAGMQLGILDSSIVVMEETPDNCLN